MLLELVHRRRLPGSGLRANIGMPFDEIPVALRQLLADAATWTEHKAYPPDEIAVRFHHRLVQIHAFPNGNGRHSRLMADLLVMQLGRERSPRLRRPSLKLDGYGRA